MNYLNSLLAELDSVVDKPEMDRLNIEGTVKVLRASCCDKMKKKSGKGRRINRN